ncbi:MAG TPA: site-2 protease family protein [Gemmataceae bacterium]|jgi:Zn-dependent protease
MGRSLRIGSAFGIGLYVHWTFLLIVLLAVSMGLQGEFAQALAVLPLFGCILLHELGHALMARTFGIGTRDITLLPIGGVARLERMSEHPGEEIAIAVAGPLVNVVIAAGLWFGMELAGLSPFAVNQLFAYRSVVDKFLVTLLASNILLVVFNLIPAFPMDGGRVFRALLSIGFGRLRGTEIAVGVSKVLAVGFILAGLTFFFPVGDFRMSPFLAVIGLFLMAAGNQELAMLRHQAMRRQPPAFGPEPPTVLPADEPMHPAAPPQPGFSGFTWDPRAGAWVEWRDGRVVGATYVNGAGRAW